jgi:N-acyl-D-amino-acid deacylase
MSNPFDILIRSGIVCDGTGSEPYAADIGIRGDRIALIAKKSGTASCEHLAAARKTIHAQELIVAPGFIDTHGHSEFSLLSDPRAEGKISQGITTEINGNCGLSAAPLFGEALKQRESDLDEYGITERWSTFREYFAVLERRKPAVNYCTLTGHGNLRASVVGYEDRRISRSDLQMMRTMLADAMHEGAIGMSTGLIYPPGIYADTEELIDLCRMLVSTENDGPCMYASHMRSEGDRLIESIGEAIAIAEGSGIRVHISHLKTSGERNWHKLDEAVSVIEKARNGGVVVTGDRYPYTAASTDLDTVLPSWTYEGGAEEELRRLQNPETQLRIRREILVQHSEPGYWEKIIITSVASEKNRWMEGKTIPHISHHQRCEPVDAVIGILIEEHLRVGAIFSSMDEKNLEKILSLPYIMIGSDSSARSFDGVTCRGKPHPRGFGSFPRFLGRFVPALAGMNLNTAIQKITLLPAQTFGISGRGVLREGAFADITIFDSEKVLDKATYEEPFLQSEGIHYVIVNGVPAVWDRKLTGLRGGRVLRRGI